MIKINKPAQAPAVLLSKGASKAAEHCKDYLAHKADYQSGDRAFTFVTTIYGHKTVKDALVQAQLRKCCFCESMVGHDGDVEHFRPKAASCQSPSTPLIRPGYYWLAYDWENLFLACSACNQRQKRNFFPLKNPAKRALSHQDDYKAELSLFINPAIEDPEKFISFRDEVVYAVGGNKRGKETINLLGLDRPIMQERRRDRLEELRIIAEFVAFEHTQPQTKEWVALVNQAKQHLANSKSDGALFAGTVRAQKYW